MLGHGGVEVTVQLDTAAALRCQVPPSPAQSCSVQEGAGTAQGPGHSGLVGGGLDLTTFKGFQPNPFHGPMHFPSP